MRTCRYFVVAALVSACAPPYERDKARPKEEEFASFRDGGRARSSSTLGDGGRAGSTDETAPATAGACASEKTQSSCSGCCDEASPEGRKFFDEHRKGCFCQAECKRECGDTYCAGRVVEPRSECAECIAAKDDACFNDALTACQKDEDCNAMLQCNEVSKCAGRPR